jgi:hypothetical protein
MNHKETRHQLDQDIPPEDILPMLFRSNMLRMVMTKHIELNKAADAKANMLIAAASIMVAIILTGMDTSTGITTGQIIIFVSAILAIVMAILVIIPKPYHTDHKHDGHNMLLYFRGFSSMTEDEYVKEMKTMMSDKNEMYEQYIRDIYHYGSTTLTQKYRLLTIGLVLFLTGIILGSASLLIGLF